MIDRNGEQLRFFKSKKELLIFVKEAFDEDIHPNSNTNLIWSNWFLSICCHNWNETYVKEIDIFENERFQYQTPKHFKKQMIIDSYGRIVNLKDLAEEAWKTKLPVKEDWVRCYPLMDCGEDWWQDSWWWTLHHNRNKNSDWWGYNGRSKKHLQQERRLSYDPTHKPFVRSKRTALMLDPWGVAESNSKAQITWKQLKIKKQWEEHI